MIAYLLVVMDKCTGFLIAVCFQQSRVGIYDWGIDVLIHMLARHQRDFFFEDNVRLVAHPVEKA